MARDSKTCPICQSHFRYQEWEGGYAESKLDGPSNDGGLLVFSHGLPICPACFRAGAGEPYERELARRSATTLAAILDALNVDPSSVRTIYAHPNPPSEAQGE